MGQAPAGLVLGLAERRQLVPGAVPVAQHHRRHQLGHAAATRRWTPRSTTIGNLPADQAVAKWGELDKEILGMYVALPRYYGKLAFAIGTNIGGAEGDASVGEPFYLNMFLKN